MNKWANFLIGFGLILAAFGLFMDTSVETRYGVINNIGLMSKSHNLVLLGGMLFIGGLISKKRTEDEPPRQAPKAVVNNAQIKWTKVKVYLQEWLTELNSWRERFVFRAINGAICTVVSLGVGPLHDRIIYLIPLPLFVALTMRKIPPVHAVRNAFLLASITSILLSIPPVALAFDTLGYEAFFTIPFIFIPTYISIGFYIKYRKQSATQPST